MSVGVASVGMRGSKHTPAKRAAGRISTTVKKRRSAMDRYVPSRQIMLSMCGALAIASCNGDSSSSSSPDAGTSSSSGGSSGAVVDGSSGGSSGSSGGSSSGSSGSPGDAAVDTGVDSGPPDPCGAALFCEKFEGYAAVGAIANNQKFGPWHAALNTGATMNLDGAHVVSGSKSLHVHIDNTVPAGGRLFADGAQPIFAGAPTRLYGRMMMYIDPNGTSIHWTFFGVNGNAEPTSPATGRNASYILSSLPKNNVNTYSFV